MSPPPVTLQYLAKRLNLGTTTVSDILLRGKKNYRQATIDLVEKTAARLGYRPNGLAQGMRGGKTQTIGLLVTFNILDPFFAELVNCLEERFEQAGFMVLLSISEDNVEKDRKALRFFETRRVEGLIVGPIYKRQAINAPYAHYKTRIPSVMFLAEEDAPYDTVTVGSTRPGAVGFIAATHLLELGHTRIGYLMAPPGRRSDVGGQPFRGFHQALAPLGLYREEWVWESARPLAELAYAQMKKLLLSHRREDLPTAFYAHNDHCAIGAMAALREAGYRVPEDFSIVGTDNIHTSAFSAPPLTTIDLHPEKLALEAYTLLMGRIKHPHHPKKYVEVEPTLVKRDSAAHHLATTVTTPVRKKRSKS